MKFLEGVTITKIKQHNLFEYPHDYSKGAVFSDCKQHRYALWRIWDDQKPFVMFIGLNPSTANEDSNDPTIESVIRLSKFNGYGGCYMMNCWSFISTDPNKLDANCDNVENLKWLSLVAKNCSDVVFAWGAFKVIKKYGRDIQMIEMFKNPKCIMKTKDGTPGHPLFKKGTTTFINFN